MEVNFSSLVNAGVIRYLETKARSPHSVSVARLRASADPKSVENWNRLGTHPDLIELLWSELAGSLPERCQWLVYGTPVLVHPASGVVFGLASGTSTYALRLPPEERAQALRAGAKRLRNYPAQPKFGIAASSFNLDDIGQEWVFGGWFRGEEVWCLAAYYFAREGVVDRSDAP